MRDSRISLRFIRATRGATPDESDASHHQFSRVRRAPAGQGARHLRATAPGFVGLDRPPFFLRPGDRLRRLRAARSERPVRRREPPPFDPRGAERGRRAEQAFEQEGHRRIVHGAHLPSCADSTGHMRLLCWPYQTLPCQRQPRSGPSATRTAARTRSCPCCRRTPSRSSPTCAGSPARGGIRSSAARRWPAPWPRQASVMRGCRGWAAAA